MKTFGMIILAMSILFSGMYLGTGAAEKMQEIGKTKSNTLAQIK
jgi:hypothetical protein